MNPGRSRSQQLLRIGSAAFLGTLGIAAAFLLLTREPETPPPSTPAQSQSTMVDLNTALPLAEKGDANAQFQVGEVFLHGRGNRPDAKLAAEWLLKAASQGHSQAQCTLGMMYEAGQGVPSDFTKAREWFRKSAEQHIPQAQYSLAVLYASGRGGPRNDPEAVQWLQRAANSGHGLAQFALAYRCQDGQGVPRDLPEALKWFTLAAQNQVPDAQTALKELSERMTRPELTQGRERVKAFQPTSPKLH